ncbi:DNA polymerase I [Gordonia phage Mayweather]|uniref:DNA polymerase I n=1 Tax=Gordonia phage Mayweather TaxID=2590931 RepID=A0A516KU56_9CAUD|nr:DNA polymerase I [Gordonia phage Mayweather]QDP45210.1 DNA polymerase I [Gordonia phage Mayweather]
MILVVSKYQLRGRARDYVSSMLGDLDVTFAGIDPLRRVEDGQDFSKAMLRTLREDFAGEIIDRSDNLTGILTLGNEALFVATGHSGIMKWRGKELDHNGVPLMATISTAAVDRNPSQAALLKADCQAFVRMVTGTTPAAGTLPNKVRLATTRKLLDELIADIRAAEAVSFDLETDQFDEFADGAHIVCIGLTLLAGDGTMSCWAVPLCHRASRWTPKWQKVIQVLAAEMRNVPVRVAHNAKFDCRWMVHFDAPVSCNFDTMLAHHILDENDRHGLKHLARVLLAAPEWDIQISNGKNAEPWYEQHPLKEIVKYCALDTWHTMRLYQRFSAQLAEDPLAHRLLTKLVMPASQSLVHIERRGVYVDPAKLDESTSQVRSELERLEDRLNTFVPRDAPYPTNWNPSNFLRWLLFEYLEMPVIESGKTGPSTKEEVMMHLADMGYPIAQVLLERVKWQKFNSGFIVPYNELITPDSRLRTTFKLHGTVTGRLSSGKPDEEKVTGAKKLRGVNLQQVPRDPVIRGVFGAAPGWTFVEADYSQVELRIAAELAQEPTMLGLYSRGEDIHMAMAMRMTGKPASDVTKEERKKAKAVNFGFLYGMGATKFISTAYSNYGVEVTEQEAKDFRNAFFDQFPMLQRWHARQRRLAHKYKRVQSPLGRVRHLPDIVSDDRGVVSEAERQAINSPVQATASDLCLLSLVLLDRKFRKMGLKASPIGTVHDAINFEVPDDELEVVLPLIKQTMENLPTRQLFDYEFTVPIVADVALAQTWGNKEEIPTEVINDSDALQMWLRERGRL